MAGTDTIRGIAFQQAERPSEIVGLLIDDVGAAVQVEDVHDIVDYALLDQEGQPLRVRQAKTRQKPKQWSARDLAQVIRKHSEPV